MMIYLIYLYLFYFLLLCCFYQLQELLYISDFYFIVRLMECNISLSSQLIVISHMNKEILDMWSCHVNTNKIKVTVDSITFIIEHPLILDYIDNGHIFLSEDVKIHTWVNNTLNKVPNPKVKVVSPGDNVTFCNLDFGESTIEGSISYRNRYIKTILQGTD